MDSCTAAQTSENFIRKEMFNTADLMAQESQSTSQRVYTPDKLDPGIDILPSQNQTLTFSAGQHYQGQIRMSGDAGHSHCEEEMSPEGFIPVGQLLRPRSPTRQCSIPEKDRYHFSLALMESKVGSEESERIFHVNKHELICAISSQTSFVNREGYLVSSIDINHYWCNFCTFSTATKTLLMEHIMEHRFHCRFCRYQSFSRADIVHHSAHTHSDFKGIASKTQFCTLLVDYLRMQHPKESQLDIQRKRKRPPNCESDCSEQLQSKVRKADDHRGNQKMKAGEKYSSDYVCFDIDLEDKEQVMEEAGKEPRPKETGSRTGSPPSLEEEKEIETLLSVDTLDSSSSSATFRHSESTLLFSKCESFSDSTNQSMANSFSPVPADGQHPTQTLDDSVLPPNLMPEVLPSNSLQLPSLHLPSSCAKSSGSSFSSCSSSPSPPNLNTDTTRSVQQGPLEWVCVYCPFTSASKDGIRRHCRRQHRGKPPKFISPCELDERSAPPLLRYDGGKISPANGQACELKSSEELTSFHQSVSLTELETTENTHSDDPPVLVKQRPVELDVYNSVRQDTPVLPVPTDSTMSDLKCCHCDYRSHLPGDLRNHIFVSHKGKSLNGVDAKKNLVFICSKSSCTFTSSSGQSFLKHAQECIPWPGPNSSDFLEESVIECLQATTYLAEYNMSSFPSSSVTGRCTERSDEFSCVHCKHEFVSNKSETKQHILDCHGSKCLVLRNVDAHRKRKKSLVYFCRRCCWEGERKKDHDLHALFCPKRSKSPVKFSGQPSKQDSETSLGAQHTQTEEGANTVFDSSGKDVCIDQGEQIQGEGDDAGDVFFMPPVTSTAENSSQSANAVNHQSSILLKTHGVPCSNTADDKKPPVDMVCDGLEGLVGEASSFPDQSAAADNLTSADTVESNEDYGLTFSSVKAALAHSGMCQTPVSPRTIAGYLSAHNSNVADSAVPLSHLLLDAKPCDNSVEASDIPSDVDTYKSCVKTSRASSIDTFSFTSDDTTEVSQVGKSSVNTDRTPDIDTSTNSGITEESHVLQDFNAVISGEISDHSPVDIKPAEDLMYPPDISLEINIAESSMSQNTVLSDIIENKGYLSPPDLSSSHVTISAASASVDVPVMDIASSKDLIPPVQSAVENGVCPTSMVPDLIIADNMVHSPHTLSDINIEQNNGCSTLSVNDCTVSKGTMYEKKTEEKRQEPCSSNADPTEGSVEFADKPYHPQFEAKKHTFSQGQDHKKNKTHSLKPISSNWKKSIWHEGHQVMCSRCKFQCNSLISLKTHVLDKHAQMISFPFRSPYHRSRHYKSNFFACPSLECMIYNYSESVVVAHYRHSHRSQPHPYADSGYTPAPVKSRRRNIGKAKEPKKLTKPLNQTTFHASKIHMESTEQIYMCLYCDQNVYTDTVSEMKAHHFSSHAGQPITIRNVAAHREKRASRFFVCDQPQCDFCTYEMTTLDKHMKIQHPERLQALADRSYQCVSCGWVTSEDASVQNHVSVMHESEGGATVVTLAHDDEQQAVEERYIECVPRAAATQDD